MFPVHVNKYSSYSFMFPVHVNIYSSYSFMFPVHVNIYSSYSFMFLVYVNIYYFILQLTLIQLFQTHPYDSLLLYMQLYELYTT